MEFGTFREKERRVFREWDASILRYISSHLKLDACMYVQCMRTKLPRYLDTVPM